MKLVSLNETDSFIYENEIRPYLPGRIFDAHTHLFINALHPDWENAMPLAKNSLLNNIDFETLNKWWQVLFADSQVSGLVLGFPTKECDINGINSYLAEHITAPCRFSLLCRPDMNIDQLERQIVQFKPAGLKPYMCFSRNRDPNSSSICEIIPEVQIALADKYNLAITLHVAKPRGMADPENISEITRLVKEYRRCNFILAHCGRCFVTSFAETMLKKLPVAENLWLDTSAVCDIGVFMCLFNMYERSRILFGTDLVTATGFRGTYAHMGLSWDLLESKSMIRHGGQEVKATFAVYENLRALLYAVRFCKLCDAEKNDIFRGNAKRLFKL